MSILRPPKTFPDTQSGRATWGRAVSVAVDRIITALPGYLSLTGGTLTGDLIVPDEAYGAGWDGSLEVPTKNALYDKIQTLGGGGGTTTNALTITNTGGAAAGATFNGSAAVTIDYSTVGAAASGHNHTGTYQPLDATLTSFAAYNTNGLLTQTAADTFTGRTITAGAGISVTNGSGVAGNPTISATGNYEGGPVTAATTTDLGTWVNQGTSSVTDGTGALILKPQVDGLVHAREKTISGSFTYYVKLDFDFLSTAAVTTAISGVAGVFLRDSSDSEILMLGLYYERVSGDEQNLWGAIIQRWTNATTFSATPVLKYNNKPWKWLKVDSNGTTLTFSVGHDGKNFTQVGTETIATFIDTVDRIGIGGIASANMTEAVITVPYFSTTAPA